MFILSTVMVVCDMANQKRGQSDIGDKEGNADDAEYDILIRFGICL